MERERKYGHGGARKGAGRKRATDPIVTYHVNITVAQASLLKEWGGGDISAGLRWLVDATSVAIRKTPRPALPYLNPPPEMG